MAVEEPAYTSILHEGVFEIRDYPELVVAEVTVGGDRDSATRDGFRLLAAYIFGANIPRALPRAPAVSVRPLVKGETIAMSAPVTQTENAREWDIRFFMPRGAALESLPLPNDPRVHLTSLPPARMAVVTFSGLAGEQDIANRTAELRAFVIRQSLKPDGPATLARYNPPWTLWFMRRNEIAIPVRSAQTQAKRD